MSLSAIDLCKLLLDEQRIKLVGLLSVAEHTHEELVTLSGLKRGVLARHLYQLQESGLVGVTGGKDGEDRYSINWARLRRWKQQIFAAPQENEATSLTPEEEMLARYVKEGVLVTIPSQAGRVALVLNWLVQKFHPGVAYPEKAVNEILGGHRVDYATLRRYLVDYALLERSDGLYRRTETS